MHRALTLAVLALSLFTFRSFPQQAPTSGSIEGIVVRADTEQPIANAEVTLTPVADTPAPGAPAAANGAGGAIVPVITGADGKFSFKDLKPATYRVAAITDSFIRMAGGQRVPNELGRLLFVEAGKSITDATIRITPAGTITGHILDENGQPATGAPVRLIRAVYNLQGKMYQGTGSTSVDDRGVYRFFALPPGRYYITAGMGPTAISLNGPRANVPRFSEMYYPGVSMLAEAGTIEVKAGNETSVDMRLKRETQTFHVRGHVITPGGGPFPQNMTAGLGYYSALSDFTAVNSPNSFDPATGTFDVSNVPPGDFRIVIHPVPQTQEQRATGLSGSVPVHVTNGDINGLAVTVAAGITVEGKLTVEGQPVSAVPNLLQLRLNIRSTELTGSGEPVPTAIAKYGNFQVAGLREEEYRAQLNLNVPGFYVKSLKFGDEDILGRTFKFRSDDIGSFEVVLKAGEQTITGTVKDAQSQPVPGIAVVFVPAQRGKFDLFRRANTDQEGKFAVTNLAPGEYKVFSWEADDNNAYMDPDFLKHYEDFGKAISVTESSNSSVDVKLIPTR